jgi:uncharacterized membrane protein YhaH (DUF805 family)
MTKLRNILGLIAAAILVLSSGAHSVLGWPNLNAQLEATHAPADLILGLKIGWLFGGLAMLVFGIIIAAIFMARLRGEGASTFPALVIGIAYIGVGAWALAVTKNPFFTIFIVPGVLLLFAASRKA